MATCPECDSLIDIDEEEVEEGETVTCDECGMELEVVSSEPLQLAAVDDEGYDEEDDLPIKDEEEEDE